MNPCRKENANKIKNTAKSALVSARDISDNQRNKNSALSIKIKMSKINRGNYKLGVARLPL